MGKPRINETDLDEQAERLGKATGLPYTLDRVEGQSRLSIKTNDAGKPTFGGSRYQPVSEFDTPRATYELIDRLIAGVQLGFDVVKRVNHHYLENQRQQVLELPTVLTFDAAEFCADCGALVYGYGDNRYFDIRERHEGVCERAGKGA